MIVLSQKINHKTRWWTNRLRPNLTAWFQWHQFVGDYTSNYASSLISWGHGIPDRGTVKIGMPRNWTHSQKTSALYFPSKRLSSSVFLVRQHASMQLIAYARQLTRDMHKHRPDRQERLAWQNRCIIMREKRESMKPRTDVTHPSPKKSSCGRHKVRKYSQRFNSIKTSIKHWPSWPVKSDIYAHVAFCLRWEEGVCI